MNSAYNAGIPGFLTRDHWIDAPLDHDNPAGQTIRVYAREVVGREHPTPESLPWLLFLQGGPGGKSPRPTSRGGWLDQALQRYRVLLLDQRGTGRSTPLTPRLAESLGAQGLCDYLAHHRADAIVRDAELFRQSVAGGSTWSTLGQSYGGFCTFTYLSLAPQALDHCLVTGGIPPIGLGAEEVYRRTWPKVIAKNAEYFRRFPEDRDRLRAIRAALTADTRLADGAQLSINRLLAPGIAFGGGEGFASVHYLLEDAFSDGPLTPGFLSEILSRTDNAAAPLYALLQEAIYCEGTSSRWAATRVRSEFPELDATAPEPLFTGEMMERWRFTEEPGLAAYREAADLLHSKEDWGPLYDESVLADNEVPIAAAVYHDDMYVDLAASLSVATRVPHLRTWITNQYEHDGLRADTAVFIRLDRMARGME